MTEQSFVSSDGVRLVYDDYGPRDGIPVAICHGIAVNASQFIEDAEYFASLGYRVLTPDLRGHGRSATPPLTREAVSLPRLAADQGEMLDHAGVARVHWCGNSLGGMVGLSAIRLGRFASLTTFGTPYRVTLPRLGSRQFVSLGYVFWGRRLISAVAAQLVSRDPAAQARIRDMANASRPEVTAAISHELRFDLVPAALAAPFPLMLIHCGGDRFVNATLGPVIRALRRKPDFRLAELPEGGHCANLDAREGFRRIMREFWGSLQG